MTITRVDDVLARSRKAIEPAMRTAVDGLVPMMREVARYHMGWTDAAGNPLEEAVGGKGIRPTLAMLGAEAAGGEGDAGITAGVAVELVHNFSLIHDDIIDVDIERHHRPTVWLVYGIARAIVAGDSLQVLAHQVLLKSPSLTSSVASGVLADATAEMIGGQADDIEFERRRNVSLEQCLSMSAGKTGALLGCASSLGAILAGAPAETVEALGDYGRHLGLAFQAVDDLLGIWGDPATTGKPAGSDLRQRKKSMPVVSALSAQGPEADELRTLLVGPEDGAHPNEPLPADAVERATYLVESCGGREWTTARAKADLDAALCALERTPLASASHRNLAELAVFVVERES
jgi:geranylgeranyl diphosphate synthase, type I